MTHPELKVEAAALLALPRCEDSWRNLDSMAACIRNLLAALREAERLSGARRAQIDRLMLEHCPDEMTPEQIAAWESHQVEAPPEMQAILNAEGKT